MDESTTCRETVFSVSNGQYGDKYQTHLLAQYESYIKSVWWMGELKQKVNGYFLTVNTILLAGLGISFAHIEFVPSDLEIEHLLHVAVPYIGIIICLIWWAMIYSYRQRNTMKLRIIKCIEDQLPLAPYKTESLLIKEEYSGIRYLVFRVSLLVPWVFAFLYVLLILFV